MREFIIGDIHGGFRALKQLLTKANFDYDNNRLISLGDLADGWSETHLVIEELKKIKNLILVRGNHDEWALKALATKYYDELLLIGDPEINDILERWYTPSFYKMTGLGQSWYSHGGEGTEYSYSNNKHLIADHLKFLNKALIYHIDEENRLFSHAGPNPYMIFEKTPEEEFYWNREFWYLAWSGKNPGKNWTEVYLGHTPTLNFPSNKEDCTRPMKRMNVWNMDNGACFNGKLSMMDINTKELFQSDVVRELYPDEKGRMRQSFNNEK